MVQLGKKQRKMAVCLSAVHLQLAALLYLVLTDIKIKPTQVITVLYQFHIKLFIFGVGLHNGKVCHLHRLVPEDHTNIRYLRQRCLAIDIQSFLYGLLVVAQQLQKVKIGWLADILPLRIKVNMDATQTILDRVQHITT